MTPKSIFFDLDGTLTDSGEGVINCAELALNSLGIPLPDRSEMRKFVGPPLWESFARVGVPENKIEEAITIYRSRYNPIGIFENIPYSGIHDLLSRLKADGHRLYVATSKPEGMALRITDRFGLTAYFELICGATLDRARDSKEAVIAYPLEQAGSQENVVMIGDTSYDVIGAAAHGIPTIGVGWGYGNAQAMLDAGAFAIADTMEELYELLK